MPAILTVTHDADGNPESYGSICPDHPQWNREGLAQAHAMNVVAKHNRENHAEPVLNLSAAAREVDKWLGGRPTPASAALSVWAELVGLEVIPARAYLDAVLAEPEDVLVHIAPF